MTSAWQKLLQRARNLPGQLPEVPLSLWVSAHSRGHTLVLCVGRGEADRLTENLRLSLGDRVLLFPEIDMPLFQDGVSDPQRLAVLSALGQPEPVTVVTHLLAFLQPAASAQSLRHLRLNPGDQAPDLEALGYQAARSVVQPGQFCHRGSILDLFPPNASALRLQLDAGLIEELRVFDPATQRSLAAAEPGQLVPPVKEPKRDSRLIDYLEANAQIILVDPQKLRKHLENMASAAADGWTYSSYAELELLHNDRLDDWQEMLDLFEQRRVLSVDLAPEESLADLDGYAAFAEWIVKQPTPWIWVTGRGRRVRANLTRRGLTEVEVIDGWLSRGFSYPEVGTVCTDREVFGEFRGPAPAQDPTLEYLPDFEEGELVVHRERGLGRFEGLISVEVLGRRRDMLRMKLANEDSFLVPPDQIDLLTPYRSAREEEPKLSELGKVAWSKTLEKAQESARAAAETFKKRRGRKVKALQIGPDTTAQKEMEDAFPYDETSSQLKAIEEIKADLESESPMDRLLCGDVGFGKTEVALRAAFKVAQSGYQVAVLVPTTVLAEQHFREFRARIGEVGALWAGQEECLEELAKGCLKVVVGTHRLFAKDVRFQKLGLLIVDEEQQFGLAHKEKLRKLARGVHCLSMSATPIPRTMQLALSGARDISLLDEPPERKRPIRTYLLPEAPKYMQAALIRELERDGQAFVLHNRVEELPSLASRLSKALKGVRFGVAHGQLPAGKLSQVLQDFGQGKLDVLVCSTIIEAGVNLPSANTILVMDAHLFGLAQLYQIRGRVGRAGEQAYCYLFVPKNKKLDGRSHRRLDTIRQMTRLGSGFEIARRDLEMRGAGDLLGEDQTGTIDKVGYSLFAQLLSESVSGVPPRKKAGCQIDLPIEAYIPEETLADTGSRIALYQRLAELETVRQLDRLREEVLDRYGPPSPPLRRLLDLAELRLTAPVERIWLEEKFGETFLCLGKSPGVALRPGQDPLDLALKTFS